MTWTLARRAERLNPSLLREILKVTERPGIISLAGGLPAAEGFPVEALREASARVLADTPSEALQYAGSEGYGPLRDWVAAELAKQGVSADASQVLITTGSQQGLDLAAKVLIDAGSRIAVESPTYLGALQAFASYEPQFHAVACDDDGPLPEALADASGARALYVQPNFQNPTGRCIPAARREAIALHALQQGLPLIEDNPYGDLWFDAQPPAPLAALGADVLYLGSFSKVLAPGLRLGYLVAPKALYPKLLQAKQAADLHTPAFNQRVVHEVVREGFLQRHVPAIRARYRAQRDAMRSALELHLGPLGCRWSVPRGGMFFWVEMPEGVDAMALFPRAAEAGVAFVPGAAFYCAAPRSGTMRLSFVTVEPALIRAGVATLGSVLHSAMQEIQVQA